VNITPGEWIVETLQLIESSTHIKLMGYALALAVLLRAIAKVIAVLRKASMS